MVSLRLHHRLLGANEVAAGDEGAVREWDNKKEEDEEQVADLEHQLVESSAYSVGLIAEPLSKKVWVMMKF